jgi:uracil-DNA glycosylase
MANATLAIVPANAQCARRHHAADRIVCVTSFAELGAMSSKSIDEFLRLLKKSPSGAVFNPWWEADEQNDVGPDTPAVRRNQLRAYLRKRLRTAQLAVIGEAVGYRGGHFSGIPMTSERLLLGRSKTVRLKSNDFFSDTNPRRTSKSEKCPDGFSEPTATIVWGTLLQHGLKPDQFVLWNAFPWHSFDPRHGMLSNRMPNKSEQAAGLQVLKAFLELFQCEQVVALGKIAAAQLEKLDVDARGIRHPASGGAKLFRQQITGIINRRQNASY